MSDFNNFTKEEWAEWAKSTKARGFARKIEERRLELLEEQNCLTDPTNLVKDYFILKGMTEGLQLAIGMMQDMIGENKNAK